MLYYKFNIKHFLLKIILNDMFGSEFCRRFVILFCGKRFVGSVPFEIAYVSSDTTITALQICRQLQSWIPWVATAVETTTLTTGELTV